jgi:hypothetical protein
VTTRSWSLAVNNSGDAGFRSWGSSVSQSLGLVGLVQTADTGQINWTTVTQPTVSSGVAGYEVWRFTDSSIFLKIEYGNGPGATNPKPLGMWLTVGTGSNGSGTLTGTVSTRSLCHTFSIGSIAGTYQSVMSYSNALGFFGMALFFGAIGSGTAWTLGGMVAKTTDANGVPTADGATVYWRGISDTLRDPPPVQALNFQTNTAQAVCSNGQYSVLPHNISTSLTGSDQQAFLHWTALPRVYPVPQMLSVLGVEFPRAATFTTTAIGTTPRNYYSLGAQTGYPGAFTNNEPASASPEHKTGIAILWE